MFKRECNRKFAEQNNDGIALNNVSRTVLIRRKLVLIGVQTCDWEAFTTCRDRNRMLLFFHKSSILT